MYSATKTMVGSARRIHARMRWNPRVDAICARARTTFALPPVTARTSALARSIGPPEEDAKGGDSPSERSAQTPLQLARSPVRISEVSAFAVVLYLAVPRSAGL